jgi:chaperone BCS1
VYGLAGELDVSLCVLTLSDRDLSDDEFMNRLAAAPKNAIILLEDIDVAMPSERRKRELEVKRRRRQEGNSFENYSGSLTMSGVLNGIDGVTTADSQIIIMTTNHKDNLDPALIRPGRYVI